MSNLPPSTFNSTSVPSQMSSNSTGQMVNHSQPNQMNFTALKPDPNSNQYHPPASMPYSNMNNYNESANSSPARPPPNMVTSFLPSNSIAPNIPNSTQYITSPSQSNVQQRMPPVNHSQAPPPCHTNVNTPPLAPSSQPYHPNFNGSSITPTSMPPTAKSMNYNSPYPIQPNAFGNHPIAKSPLVNNTQAIGSFPGSNVPKAVVGPPGVMPLLPGAPPPGPPSGPLRASPAMPGPPSGPLRASPAMPGPPSGPSRVSPGVPGLSAMGPPRSSPAPGPPRPSATMMPPSSIMPPLMPSQSINGPPVNQMGPPKGPVNNMHISAPNLGLKRPPNSMLPPVQQSHGLNGPPTGPLNGPSNTHPLEHIGPPTISTPPTRPVPISGPPGSISNVPLRPPQGNMQQRYAQQPINNQVPPLTAFNTARQSTDPYNAQGLTQQMGQLSVTKQGFDQLWGHQMVDLMQCRHILPEYPEDPPEIKLGNQFSESANCSPEIFRCTVNRIPDTNALLQKSRLPLGILIHPFKDLNHLPVIQCSTIVRCRACRTYINPFVYFVDSKRWKCNLCYRVNDLPDEFQYDPVSKSYGDPSRRPEIKSATIEYIAPSEYMLRPPQPAVYLFLLDVSQMARESGYIQVFCDTLKTNLDQLPGDSRTQVGFICYDTHVHYYLMSEGLTRPKEMTVLDIDDVFLPSPTCLLVNLRERLELVQELLTVLPQRYSGPGNPASALGAALQAAHKLMAPTGGRITVFQTCLPNIGPGALQPREDPNARSSKEVAHLTPATDFYKRLALDCSGTQISVDLFVLNSQYCDLATLSGMSKFSAGSVYHVPLYKSSRGWQADQFRKMLTRYLIRKIGFEAVLRVRCTRGIAIHTFHGNFFVRSTDLLSLPNVSPDSGFGMQLAIEESLADLQQVCFQAALLYTSSKGERRIRVHTMALPTASNLTDVLHSADQQCIIGLLSKMAVDRCVSASMSEAREALINVAVDALSAHRLAQNLPAGSLSAALHAPMSLRLLPLYLLALLKRRAFRTGTSTRLDDRVADMCDMKTWPLSHLVRAVYPDLYPVHQLAAYITDEPLTEESAPAPPRLHLTAERVNTTGAYLLDDGETMIIYVGSAVSPDFLKDTFGVSSFSQLQDEARSLPRLENVENSLLHMFIAKLNEERPYAANLLVLKDTSPSRSLFTERLVDDRVESSFSYYEFLQHVKTQVK